MKRRNDKIPVLYLDNSYTFGGAINSLEYLVRALDKERYEPILVTGSLRIFSRSISVTHLLPCRSEAVMGEQGPLQGIGACPIVPEQTDVENIKLAERNILDYLSRYTRGAQVLPHRTQAPGKACPPQQHSRQPALRYSRRTDARRAVQRPLEGIKKNRIRNKDSCQAHSSPHCHLVCDQGTSGARCACREDLIFDAIDIM